MRKLLTPLCALLFALFVVACDSKKTDDSKEVAEEQNEDNAENSDTKKDSDFAVEAADGGLYEVQLATLALTRATSPEVKKFAQMMVDDHSKVNQELKDLAGKKGIALPDVMGEKKQERYYEFERDEKKENFDKKFMEQMVDDHEEDVKNFEKEAENGEDPDLKSWAAAKLSALRHHLEEAKRINDSLKK